MHKYIAILLLLLSTNLVFAQSNDLEAMINALLLQNTDYQQALNRYKQEEALYTIDKSLSWFDVSFIYKQYDNDFTRNDITENLEHSSVNEKDKRRSFELNKQLFPKDFENGQNSIGSKLDLLRYSQETKLLRSSISSDIFDELIAWYEVSMKINQWQQELDVLYRQERTLESLETQRQIDSQTLIANLEDIDNKENDLYAAKKSQALYERKYGDILPGFLVKMQDYVNSQPQADTLLFHQKIQKQIQVLKRDINKINSSINFRYAYFYLPEIKLRLSYNWRENRQNWDITENNELGKMKRNQDEEYPEGNIEISLPFNFLSNTRGKLTLLKAYGFELDYRSKDMELAWDKFAISRINQYQAATLQLRRKTRLKDLYEENFALQSQRFKEEPTLLGDNPSFRLQKESSKAEEARVEMKIAEMELYKEIFIINNLKEDIQ
jgi:hypothetical protein